MEFFCCWWRTPFAKRLTPEFLLRWCASSRREKLHRWRGGVMSTKMVSYTLETLPELTEADIAELEALAARPDSEIDLSDAPELTAEAVEEGNSRPFLSSGEAADYGAGGCGCAGVAEVAGQRLSVAHQCHSAAGDADGASRGGGEIGPQANPALKRGANNHCAYGAGLLRRGSSTARVTELPAWAESAVFASLGAASGFRWRSSGWPGRRR